MDGPDYGQRRKLLLFIRFQVKTYAMKLHN